MAEICFSSNKIVKCRECGNLQAYCRTREKISDDEPKTNTFRCAACSSMWILTARS